MEKTAQSFGKKQLNSLLNKLWLVVEYSKIEFSWSTQNRREYLNFFKLKFRTWVFKNGYNKIKYLKLKLSFLTYIESKI